MRKKVAIVMAVYNRTAALKRCIESLKKNDTKLFDLYLVDNGSSEDVAAVAKEYKAQYVRLPKNKYVSYAVNYGFVHFNIANSYPYVMFMGSDVYADSKLIAQMIDTMDADPNVAITGPTHYEWGSNTSLTSGLSIHPITSLLINTLHRDEGNPINHFHSLYLVRSEAFKRIGMYDAVLYPMIYEEPDLGERMFDACYIIKPTFQASIWHPIGAGKPIQKVKQHKTPKERLYNNPAKAYLFFRNRILYMSTYSPLWQFLIFAFCINPLIFLYYLPSIEPKYLPHAIIGIIDGFVFAITRSHGYISRRNKSVLSI